MDFCADGDGLGNNADPDDDNDGMSDSYESLHGLNPLVDDSRFDLDRDGMNNLNESLAGTAANDPGSVFRVDTLEIIRDTLRLHFRSVPDRTYVVYGAVKSGGKFELIGDPIRARDLVTVVVLPYDPKQSYALYHVQVLAR